MSEENMKYTENYEVDLEAFEKMHETIGDLLDAEFGVDCDHDSNVEFILIDRQRTHSLHYSPIPYYEWDNLEEMENALRRYWLNFTHAMHEYERLQSTINYFKSDKRREEEREAEGHAFEPSDHEYPSGRVYCAVKGCSLGQEKDAIHHRGEMQWPGGIWIKIKE